MLGIRELKEIAFEGTSLSNSVLSSFKGHKSDPLSLAFSAIFDSLIIDNVTWETTSEFFNIFEEVRDKEIEFWKKVRL